jgi:hypothetical protein
MQNPLIADILACDFVYFFSYTLLETQEGPSTAQRLASPALAVAEGGSGGVWAQGVAFLRSMGVENRPVWVAVAGVAVTGVAVAFEWC